MQELPVKLHELEALVLRLDKRVQERRRERHLNKRQTSSAPPRPRYEPPVPDYNPSNDVAPMVIDAIRRGMISDAERARRFCEDLCLYCGNAGHHRDQCAELKAKEAWSGRPTVP
ncbi:hypothetical protein RI367_000747 [Sorochytrium milnesiophthora]